MTVTFSGGVREEIPEAILAQLEADLPQVFQKIDADRVPQGIAVPRVFSGHSPEYDLKVTLAVEVTYDDGYETHIVKIGRRDQVKQDSIGWQECTRRRMVASRIFSPVRLFELNSDRAAVVYRDAFSLFGPEGFDKDGSQPKLLEEAIHWAVMDDKPDPLSAERALAHIFTDLGMWFYRGASDRRRDAWNFYNGHLRRRHEDQPSDDVLRRWQDDTNRQTLRRHAVWVLVGRDVPDADPVEKPARYLDPIEYVNWAMADSGRERLPETLVGRSHGDLHGRNILVGVRRHEVQYPAVFDYEAMSAQNVIAWDFAKLEMELKVRLLPAVIRDADVFTWLVKESKLRKIFDGVQKSGLPSENAQRADRLAAFYKFEELLHQLSGLIRDDDDAGRIGPLVHAPTGVKKLDRLLGVLLRVRREAANWLGFAVSKRQTLWKDELYFALGVYGLLNIRWDYSPSEQEAALISAGVALAHMPSTPRLLKQMIAREAGAVSDFPSYRVPLAISYRLWKAKEHKEGCEFVEKVAVTVRKPDGRVATDIDVLPNMYHAIPLLGQAALLEMECGLLHPVERFLEKLRDEAKTFEDYETLARIGRLYKEAGDKKAEEEANADNESEQTISTRPPSLQMYDRAFAIYAEAFETTKDWYVGINAATMAQLAGNHDKAVEIARQVAAICSPLENEKKDRYWLFATEGEAALILGEPAENFYRSALNELTPGQQGMADSSYKQACRLWKSYGADAEDRVGSVLRLFEASDARGHLTKHFLGRQFVGERQ